MLLFWIGFTPVSTRAFGDDEIEPFRSVEWQAKALTGEVTGVEFARVTIGGKTYLIRGDKGGTVIPNRLLDEMKMHSGTLDFHSHPHNDDCIPSKSDRLMMRKLRQTTGQRESTIVTPNGRTSLFDEHGVIETGTISSTLDDARRRALMELFGGGK